MEFVSFLMTKSHAVLSNFKSSSMVIKESDDLPIVPKALIDKLTNATLEILENYTVFFRSLLICKLDSKPTVNSLM